MVETIKKILNLNELGSEVTIDITKIEDRIPKGLAAQIQQDPVGKIIDYKMTDGMGIGIIIKFKNGVESWFFEEEIKYTNLITSCDKNDLINKSVSNKKYKRIDREFRKQKNIYYLINPMNFINWLIYSTSDIF